MAAHARALLGFASVAAFVVAVLLVAMGLVVAVTALVVLIAVFALARRALAIDGRRSLKRRS